MRKPILLSLFLAAVLPGTTLAQSAPPPETPEATEKAEDPEAQEGLEPQVETVPTPGEDAVAIRAEDGAAGQAPWSPFVDTRLTFVFADDNVLAAPGETQEPSPGPQFRATNRNNLFFENYDTKDTGFETLSHLVLYKQTPTFFEGLYGEFALVLRLQVDPDNRSGVTRISDSSSYVRLVYQPEGWGPNENVSFTGFPVTSDRFRLGYSYRLTWGGDDVFPQAGYSVPGARFQITRDRWYAWLGGKSTVLNEEVQTQYEGATEQVANYGALAGAGVDLTETLRLEGGAGFFTKGTNPQQSVRGEKIHAGGGSVQLAWHVGRPVGTSIDLRLYKNDPESLDSFFRPEVYGGPVSWVLKSEFSYLTQTLADPENPGSTIRQPAKAGDVNGAVKFGLNRVFLDAVYQDLSFILFNVPSFVPFVDFAENMDAEPELFVALGYDRFIEALHLTPGVRVGVQRPAYVVTDRLPLGTNPPAQLTGQRAVVVRDSFNRSILPADAEVKPIYAMQGTARLDLAESMAILGEVSFLYDPNRATFARLVSGEAVSVLEDPYILGFNIVAQARF